MKAFGILPQWIFSWIFIFTRWFGLVFSCPCFLHLLDSESKHIATNDSTRMEEICAVVTVRRFFDRSHLSTREPHFL